MEPIKLTLSIPFRLDGTPQQFPGEVFHFTSSLKSAYLQALKAELFSAAPDLADCEIVWLELSAGFVFLDYEQLMELVRLVRQQFHTAESLMITACCEPGRISTGTLNFCKNVQMQDLSILYRCSDPLWAAQNGLLPAKVEMEHSRSVFEHSVFQRYSLLLDAQGQTAEQWKATLYDAAGAAPQRISLCHAQDAHRSTADVLLSSFGYRQEGGQYLAKNALPLPAEPASVLGCGLGAVSCLDGLRCQNTSDLALYLKHSAQIEKIATLLP